MNLDRKNERENLSWASGLWISVDMNGEKIFGQIFTFDNINGTLVLQSPVSQGRIAAPGKVDMYLINTNSISSFELLNGPPKFVNPWVFDSMASNPSLGSLIPVRGIPWETTAMRESKNASIIAERITKINEQVPRYAQDIFDALSKTMECQWQGDIITLGSVRVPPPYTDCFGNDPVALDRVRKVVRCI